MTSAVQDMIQNDEVLLADVHRTIDRGSTNRLTPSDCSVPHCNPELDKWPSDVLAENNAHEPSHANGVDGGMKRKREEADEESVEEGEIVIENMGSPDTKRQKTE